MSEQRHEARDRRETCAAYGENETRVVHVAAAPTPV